MHHTPETPTPRVTRLILLLFIGSVTLQVAILLALSVRKAALYYPASPERLGQYVFAAVLPSLAVLAALASSLFARPRLVALLRASSRGQLICRTPFWVSVFVLQLAAASLVPNPSISLTLLALGSALVIALWSVMTADARPILACWPGISLLLTLIILNLIPAQGRWGEVTHLYGFPDTEPLIGVGGRLVPNLRIHLKGIDGPEARPFVTNRDGFRNAVEVGEKGPQEVRILNLGDSFSIGFHLHQERFLGPLLERALGQIATTLGSRVLNAEISDPAYGLYYLQKHGLTFAPDYVLLGLCGNDLVQAYAFAGPGERLAVDEAGRIGVNPAYARSRFRDPVVRFRSLVYRSSRSSAPVADGAHPLSPFLNPATGFLDLASVKRLRRRLGITTASQARSYEKLTEEEVAAQFKYLVDGYPNIGFFLQQEPGPVRQMYATTFSLLLQFKHTAAASGAQFLLIYYPSPFEIIPEEWARICTRWRLDPADFDVAIHRRRIAGFCKQAGIPMIDPVALFLAEPDREALFLPGDSHLSERAHTLLALQVKDAILDHPAPGRATASSPRGE